MRKLRQKEPSWPRSHSSNWNSDLESLTPESHCFPRGQKTGHTTSQTPLQLAVARYQDASQWDMCRSPAQGGLLFLDKKILVLHRGKKKASPFLSADMWSCLEVQHPSSDHKTKAQNGSAESLNKPVSLNNPVTVIVSLPRPGLFTLWLHVMWEK